MNASRVRVICILALAACLSALLALRGHAVESVHLSLGDVEGEAWSVAGASLQIEHFSESEARVVVLAASAELPGDLGKLTALQLVCDRAVLSPAEISCQAGNLGLDSSRLGRQKLPVSFRYIHADGQVHARVRSVRLAGGRVAVSARYRDGRWSADVRGDSLSLSGVFRELVRAGIRIPPLDAEGALDIDAKVSGRAADIYGVEFTANLKADSFSDASGQYAGEDLDMRLGGKVKPTRAGWAGAADLVARQGAVYIDPLYVEVGSRPLSTAVKFDWHAGKRQLELKDVSYDHPGHLRVSGRVQVALADEAPLRSLDMTLHDSHFPAAYDAYIQPWLNESLAGNLEVKGGLTGHLRVEEGRPVQVSADLGSLTLAEKSGLFGFSELTGELDWSASRVPEYSTLSWESGHVYRVALGAAGLEVESTGNTVRLVRPMRMPVLDGALDVESFGLEYSGENGLRWHVDSILTPVSMSQLTRALQWPEFGGKLSGVIPDVRYAAGRLTVGGVLLVRVFDGVVTLRDLRLLQPFGLVPRMEVSAQVDNIDLESLTGAFSFGRIEGRLDGRVDGLVLESWRPVAFDAEIGTPAGDRSRHRISQKAVDNISNIGGGGVGGALSRSFLQFFDDFPYDRLGIRCRLENGVCDMGGVAPAERGYYLVKGRFLPPRLDVVGYADRVDWDSLVAQIIAVTGEKGVVVE